MIGPANFIDEIDCGSFFDHIDDLLDFPNEDIEAGLSASDSGAAAFNSAGFPSIWNTHSESLPGSDSVFSNNSASDLSAELSVPYEDIVQLEWLSNFVEDSQCGASLTIKKEESSSINKDSSHSQFQTSSPVSVLESSSSCSGDKTLPHSPEMAAAPGRRGRARSKRPRPATFNPRPAIQLISPTSSVNENDVPQSFAVPKAPSGQAVRKCMHCEITKTPQWRAGPMGPKTLCNACGVRYKSGRLFPEYRPAASPTFVPSLHSNSHKKVLEMRTKMGDPAPVTMINNSPELIPNKSNPALDYI
ncbi:Zinc finger, GATA-type [Corchorus olitorius]|uniref:GATA transcription factor n=1 Tax=Corchorus olitorius TaxID=93759 RepID=A0A1R3HKW3_9ROSI|nr:Zinc finger, GATA-type [Corchorus olitorius]